MKKIYIKPFIEVEILEGDGLMIENSQTRNDDLTGGLNPEVKPGEENEEVGAKGNHGFFWDFDEE